MISFNIDHFVTGLILILTIWILILLFTNLYSYRRGFYDGRQSIIRKKHNNSRPISRSHDTGAGEVRVRSKKNMR